MLFPSIPNSQNIQILYQRYTRMETYVNKKAYIAYSNSLATELDAKHTLLIATDRTNTDT